MIVLFLCLIGAGLIGLCVRAPAGQRLIEKLAGGGGGGREGGMVAMHGGGGGGGGGRREGGREEDGKGYRDAKMSLAYVAPPERRVEDANRVELYGGLA